MFRQLALNYRLGNATSVSSDSNLDERCLSDCGFRSRIEFFQRSRQVCKGRPFPVSTNCVDRSCLRTREILSRCPVKMAGEKTCRGETDRPRSAYSAPQTS